MVQFKHHRNHFVSNITNVFPCHTRIVDRCYVDNLDTCKPTTIMYNLTQTTHYLHTTIGDISLHIQPSHSQEVCTQTPAFCS